MSLRKEDTSGGGAGSRVEGMVVAVVVVEDGMLESPGLLEALLDLWPVNISQSGILTVWVAAQAAGCCITKVIRKRKKNPSNHFCQANGIFDWLLHPPRFVCHFPSRAVSILSCSS